MRDIRFRAKTRMGLWVRGYLNGSFDIYKIIDEDGECTYVLQETIGQFTGLYDKNETPIYEGDIVKKETFYDKPPTYRKETFAKVKWIDKFACFFLVDNDDRIFWELAEDKRNIEVVGNEFDNPDLLGA